MSARKWIDLSTKYTTNGPGLVVAKLNDGATLTWEAAQTDAFEFQRRAHELGTRDESKLRDLAKKLGLANEPEETAPP